MLAPGSVGAVSPRIMGENVIDVSKGDLRNHLIARKLTEPGSPGSLCD